MGKISQKTVKLLGGASSFDALCPADALQVAEIVEARLMNALCMKCLPKKQAELKLWENLLACAIVAYSSLDVEGVKSENVKSYSYTLSDSAGTWKTLENTAGDLLSYFSKCRDHVSMQTDLTWWQYGTMSENMRWNVGGAL